MRRIGVLILATALALTLAGHGRAEECPTLGLTGDEILQAIQAVFPIDPNPKHNHVPWGKCDPEGWGWVNKPLKDKFEGRIFWFGDLAGLSWTRIKETSITVGVAELSDPDGISIRTGAFALVQTLERRIAGLETPHPFYRNQDQWDDDEHVQRVNGFKIVRAMKASPMRGRKVYRLFWLIRAEKK